jgi:hypothetical protein
MESSSTINMRTPTPICNFLESNREPAAPCTETATTIVCLVLRAADTLFGPLLGFPSGIHKIQLRAQHFAEPRSAFIANHFVALLGAQSR